MEDMIKEIEAYMAAHPYLWFRISCSNLGSGKFWIVWIESITGNIKHRAHSGISLVEALVPILAAIRLGAFDGKG